MSATLLQRYSFNGTLTGDGSLNLALQNTSTTLGTPTYTAGPVAGTQGLNITTATYLQLPYSAPMSFSNTSVFSFGGWFKSSLAYNGFFNNHSTTAPVNGLELFSADVTGINILYNYISNTNGVTQSFSTGAFPVNTWSHYWCTCDGTTIKIYIDNVLIHSTSSGPNNFSSTSGWIIGRIMNTGFRINGAIYDIRWYSGIVTPTVAMTAIVTIQSNVNTWNRDISSLKSTTKSYSGTQSLCIIGITKDYATYPELTMSALRFDQDFTIEAWLYVTISGESLWQVCKTDGVANTDYIYHYNYNSYQQDYVANAGGLTSIQSSIPFVLNQWNHSAMSYKASTGTVYTCLNGTVTSMVKGALTVPSGRPLTLFHRRDYSPGFYTEGYIDNLRVSQSCLYTAAYTVPDPNTWSASDNNVIFYENFEPIIQPIKLYNFNFSFNQSKPTYANIGIGTNNPIRTLDINGDLNVSNAIYKNNQQLTNWSKLNNDIYYNKGSVGINKNALSLLDINGTIRAMTRLTNSDIRLKKEIQDETLGLSFTNQLIPKTFTYINNLNPEQNNKIHGFIAQDIANIDNSGSYTSNNGIVSIDSDGFYNIDIASLVTPLINSIKELSLENNIITDKVNKLIPPNI